MRIVAALGGNALARRGQPISVPVQRANAAVAAAALAPVLREHDVTLTHGNGPQVGLLLLDTEASTSAPPAPLDVVGAESEGLVGYLLEQALRTELPELALATVLTQTVVAPGDPALARPTKPIGPVYDATAADRLRRERGLALARDGAGWRRVVPSPEPLAILEAAAVRHLVDGGFTVIASGGGGVPVVLDDDGRPTGVEGVVDKDLAAVVLAELVGAELLLLLTDVDAVYAAFGTPDARRIETLTAAGARALVAAGAAGAGSMGPKLEAAARMAERGGRAVIASLADAAGAVAGTAGTQVSG